MIKVGSCAALKGNMMTSSAIVADDRPDAATARAMMDPAERQTRVHLAALYRLVALQDWDDLIFTHISARVPGPEHHFLINPFGLFYEEITASSLVKIDLDGKVIGQSSAPINAAGFNIHSAIHAARNDAQFVLHLHSDAGVAVAAQIEGLLPLTQNALRVMPFLAYHDYEGIALNIDERVRLVSDIGIKTLVLLRNHGTLSIGQSPAEAWLGIYFLERACRQQIMALSAGRTGVLLASDAAQRTSHDQAISLFPRFAERAWPGLLRLVDRRSPGYDA
jgi:ribulose-5-phosphate 4-epimerase/fuculose-1-phosphate aldolase